MGSTTLVRAYVRSAVVVHNLVLFARLNPHNPSQPGPDPNDPPPAAYMHALTESPKRHGYPTAQCRPPQPSLVNPSTTLISLKNLGLWTRTS